MKTSKQKIKRKIMIQDFKGKEIFNMENEKVKNVINIRLLVMIYTKMVYLITTIMKLQIILLEE